ncbi:glycosyltransferase family 4 protein [Croceibacterium aestuarii]|uniref:glycosyltransferase family 4 protein n=1 Tax=Croceibacterium aestuarii TaxID=3064139 RepID=UPI00272DE04E|nr:glycosyltransferase family 4 protein [Croceibacterium sp. D39]
MKILLLTAYFPPDLSAGSFRCEALAAALGRADEVHVVTAQPHRYASHTASAPNHQVLGRVTIHRVPVRSHDGSMFSQARSYLDYAVGALRYVHRQDYDVVFATSSRLFTGVLGAVIATWKRRPLYLDVRDIFVDTLKDVLTRRAFFLVRPFATLLERFAISRATTINLVSQGFEDYFRNRYPGEHFTFLTNGIDDYFVGAPVRTQGRKSIPANIVYAGNIGEGQGLEHIIPAAARRLEGQAIFSIYGEGARRPALERNCALAGVQNVLLQPPVPRHRLLEVYESCDALLVHLNAYDAFLKVLPSKIFEYGALGKPIIAGVAGYSVQFLREHLPDATVFEPRDVEGLVTAVKGLTEESPNLDRTVFVAKFRRDAISEQIAQGVRRIADTSAE